VTLVHVGNDVVDLGNPRTRGRAADERFVSRVFDEAERDAIRRAEDADLELWARWAAKEAGFKVISKAIGSPPPFLHRAFKVTWHCAEAEGSTERPEDSANVIRRGVVRYHERVAEVRVVRLPSLVHAVALAAPEGTAPGDGRIAPHVARLDAPGAAWSGPLEQLVTLLSEREADAVYSRPSAAVRVGARADLAFHLGVSEDRIEIVCAPGHKSQRPPRVLLDGEETEADVSLSHDGPWIAWAVWVGGDKHRRIS
jgi:phosphopantetheinyl transferase (holo-ACP synthase)